MRRALTVAVGLAVAISLAGCGSNAAATTATASLKAELLQQSAAKASPFTFTDTQAQCAASRIVTGVGLTNLHTYGLLDAENKTTDKTLDGTVASTKDATTIVDAIINCLGPDTFTSALRAAVEKSLPGEKAAAQRQCLEAKLTIAALKPMFVATLGGDRSAAEKFYLSLGSCMPKK